MKKNIGALIALAIVAGCVSAGNATLKGETNDTISEKIEKGMSMAEVRSMLGDPFETTFTDGGLTIWNYELAEGQMTAQSFIPIASMFSSGMKGTKKQLVILFDEADKVSKFTMSESDFQSKSGIIRQ